MVNKFFINNNCELLHQWFNKLKHHSFPFNENDIPKNGIYILFENGEKAHFTNRIVRIGTHTGKNQLRSRLKQHFINEKKDRSIFRKNIGRALLNKVNDPFLEKWNLDLTTRKAREKYSNSINFEKQNEIEKKVSNFIQNNFTFVVLQVDEKDKRLDLESKIISTVSLCSHCKATDNWLGLSSPKEKIRTSGLWLVNELWKKPLSKKDMSELELILKQRELCP